jgi:chromosome segregation ATPase
VAKEEREEIWNRFKAASTVINKRHQQHFEGIRAKEEENLARKTELCEKVEAIAAEENKGSSDWEKHTKQIIELQAEWKTIGFAPQKMNVKIFERFRAACDDFFGRKAEFFKTLKDSFKENADKKRALIEKAKALQDSTEWKSTADKLISLQKEWKTIGMVPKKLGDQLWEEFLGACNKFFEARKAAGAGQHSEEYANLEKKREVVEKLKAITEEAGDNIQEKVQALVEEYQAIGHVPFKEKDKLYAEYHEVLDRLYKELNISVAKRRLNNFKQNLKQVAERGENALDTERARLFRQYETLKQEIQTYENNLGFLNASSKKGSSLIDEMNRKVQKLKDDLNLVKEKIKAIDAENKSQQS